MTRPRGVSRSRSVTVQKKRSAEIVRKRGLTLSITVTAGNASGIDEGAATIIVASEAAIRSHSLMP